MAGWYPVCDQRPLQGGEWVPVKIPMLGVRFCEMQDGTGYLAVRYSAARYIYGDGVPQHIFDVLRKHRGASMYLRQQVKGKYPCIDIMKYDSPAAYQADEGPVKEKLVTMAKQRLEKVTSPEMDLFGPVTTGVLTKRKRSSRTHLIGSILEDRP
jgi:hypothetical protein